VWIFLSSSFLYNSLPYIFVLYFENVNLTTESNVELWHIDRAADTTRKGQTANAVCQGFMATHGEGQTATVSPVPVLSWLATTSLLSLASLTPQQLTGLPTSASTASRVMRGPIAKGEVEI